MFLIKTNSFRQADSHSQCELWKLENICAQSENFVVNAVHPNQWFPFAAFNRTPNIALFYTLYSLCLLLFDDFAANVLCQAKVVRRVFHWVFSSFKLVRLFDVLGKPALMSLTIETTTKNMQSFESLHNFHRSGKAKIFFNQLGKYSYIRHSYKLFYFSPNTSAVSYTLLLLISLYFHISYFDLSIRKLLYYLPHNWVTLALAKPSKQISLSALLAAKLRLHQRRTKVKHEQVERSLSVELPTCGSNNLLFLLVFYSNCKLYEHKRFWHTLKKHV